MLSMPACSPVLRVWTQKAKKAAAAADGAAETAATASAAAAGAGGAGGDSLAGTSSAPAPSKKHKAEDKDKPKDGSSSKKAKTGDGRRVVTEAGPRGSDAVHEADARVSDLKAKNPLYASLFTSSQPALSGDAERKNLFIRTAAPLFTQNRG